jgi:hypothetical protein
MYYQFSSDHRRLPYITWWPYTIYSIRPPSDISACASDYSIKVAHYICSEFVFKSEQNGWMYMMINPNQNGKILGENVIFKKKKIFQRILAKAFVFFCVFFFFSLVICSSPVSCIYH